MTSQKYCMWENFGREKLANLVNRELAFAKNFLANIHRYTEYVFGICTDFSLYAKFFLANSFYVPVWLAKNFPHQNFPVYGNYIYTNIHTYIHQLPPYIDI